MCNAWNHPPGCTCGWGGDGHLGRRTTGNNYLWFTHKTLLENVIPFGQKQVYTDSHVNPNAHCPVCGARVFFYQSPYGGRVYFDELGWPWPKHPCTDNSQHHRPLASVDSQSLDRLYARLCALNLPTRFARDDLYYDSQSAPATTPAAKKIDEAAFKHCMEQGETMERRGEIDQAAMLFAEAIKEDFCSARAWFALSRVLTDQAERAYCLTKVLRLATDQDHIKCEAIKSELARLRVDQLKHPRILWSTKLPTMRPQPQRPIKPVQAVQPPSKDIESAVKYTLAVRIAKGGYRVIWHLLATGIRYHGEVLFRGSPNTALLQAIINGLQEANKILGVSQVELTVVSNYETVIKQIRGEVKINNEQDRTFINKIHTQKPKNGKLIFVIKSGNDIEKYFES